MKKERNPRPPKKMKPVFLVFYEGETEEAYIYFLMRQSSQVPVRIIPRITALSISQDYINRIKRNVKLDNSDKIRSFLMYDLDRNDVAVKIETCKDSVNISSNPYIELWFLFHSTEQKCHDYHGRLCRKTGKINTGLDKLQKRNASRNTKTVSLGKP